MFCIRFLFLGILAEIRGIGSLRLIIKCFVLDSYF